MSSAEIVHYRVERKLRLTGRSSRLSGAVVRGLRCFFADWEALIVQRQTAQESRTDSERTSQTFAQRLVYVEIRRSVDF